MSTPVSTSKKFLLAIASLPGFLAMPNATATEVIVTATQVGGYYLGSPPDNSPTFQNYFVGQTSHPAGSGTYTITPERRSFFLFDLSSVPVGEPIVGAEFLITNVFGGVGANFSAAFGFTETVVFTSTPFTAAAILDPAGAGVAVPGVFSSFGTGTTFGTQIFTSGSAPGPPAGTLTIPLSPGALGEIGSKAGTSSWFVISGRLVTYDPAVPGPATLPTPMSEFVFGLTDVVAGGTTAGTPFPMLVIHTIPEPSALALLPVGAALAILRVRRITGASARSARGIVG
jgi:hypothetical protein